MKKHLILTVALGCIVLCSCGSSKKIGTKNSPAFTDERREAVEAQVSSVVAMLKDDTKTAQELCEPIKRLADTLKFAIRYDGLFDANKEYRALARHLSYLLSVDERGFDVDCFYDFLWIPYL